MDRNCICPITPCPACVAYGQRQTATAKAKKKRRNQEQTIGAKLRAQADHIVQGYQQGHTLEALSGQTGYTQRSVRKVLKVNGIYVRQRPAKGKGYQATPDLVTAYQAGATLRALAQQAGVSKSTMLAGLRRVGVYEYRMGKNGRRAA